MSDEMMNEGNDIIQCEHWRFLRVFYRTDYSRYAVTEVSPLSFEDWYTEYIYEVGNYPEAWV